MKSKQVAYNVVLFEPEIPQNTGNIGRLCVGTGAKLHLIEPFGFKIDDKSLRRAGLDYWPHLDYQIYKDWDHFLSFRTPLDCLYFLSKKQGKIFYQESLNLGDFFVFGKETKGLPKDLLQKNQKRILSVPIFGQVRSYNLSNTVAMVLSEAIRQIKF